MDRVKECYLVGMLLALIAVLAGCSSENDAGSVIIQAGLPPLAQLYGTDGNNHPVYVVQLPGVLYVPNAGTVIVKNVLPDQEEATITVKPLESGGISVKEFLMVFKRLKVYGDGSHGYDAEQERKLDAGEPIHAADFGAILKKRLE